jgi:hypothetical protein
MNSNAQFLSDCAQGRKMVITSKHIPFSFDNIVKNPTVFHPKADRKNRRLSPFASGEIISTHAHFKYVRAQVLPLLEYLNRDFQKALINRFCQIFNEFEFMKAYKDLTTIVNPVTSVLNLCVFEDLSLLLDDVKRQNLADTVSVHCEHQFNNLTKTAFRLEWSFDELVIESYGLLVELTAHYKIKPPYNNKGKKPLTAAQCESGILRFIDGEYWQDKFDLIAKRTNEHIAIALGKVRKKYSPYVSKGALQDHKQQQDNNKAYLEMMDVINTETGDKQPLAELVALGSGNSEKRRIELMVRCRGLEDIALKEGKEAVFITITAPSKYHKNSHKWNLSSPRDTSDYLCVVWSQIRAQLARLEIDYNGVRVSEPHCDATPHWHVLLFVDAEKRDLLINTCRKYATAEDENELWVSWEKHQRAVINKKNKHSRKHWYSPRFVAEIIDPKKGSATGYIAKYISKNINGSKMNGEIDDEAEIEICESAQRVTAWASLWSIRQFQFFGAASVSVWRECRRSKSGFDCCDMEKVRQAADKGDWQEFTHQMSETKLVLAYEDAEETNNYNEVITRVKGVKLLDLISVTRLESFELQKRSLSLSWSPVINCTHPKSEQENNWTLSDKDKNNYKKMGFDDGSLNFLLSGNAVFIRGQKFEVINNEIRSD